MDLGYFLVNTKKIFGGSSIRTSPLPLQSLQYIYTSGSIPLKFDEGFEIKTSPIYVPAQRACLIAEIDEHDTLTMNWRRIVSFQSYLRMPTMMSQIISAMSASGTGIDISSSFRFGKRVRINPSSIT